MLGFSQGVVVLFLLAAVAGAQNVHITWVGQACFYIRTEGGPTVVVDPPAANVGYTLPTTPADAVTISHNHGDHNNSAGVSGNFTLIDGRPTTERSEMTAAAMPFVLVPGFHDNTNGSARGRNTIIRWDQGGLRFAQFGDFGQDALTDAQLADLRSVDVAMVPAGGFFTIDNQGAARLIEQFKPKIAILMHYRTALGGPAQLMLPPAVASPFPQVKYKPANATLSRATMPDTPEVWVMEPRADAAVVNAASFAAGIPVAPSALATIGGKFTGSATASFTSVPLPKRLGETEAFIGTESVPLLFCFSNPNQFSSAGVACLNTSRDRGTRSGTASGSGKPHHIASRPRAVHGYRSEWPGRPGASWRNYHDLWYRTGRRLAISCRRSNRSAQSAVIHTEPTPCLHWRPRSASYVQWTYPGICRPMADQRRSFPGCAIG